MILIVVITAITFFLLYAGGGNIARRILGEQASNATVVLKTHQLGLDRPIVVQFWDWVTRAVTGDFGVSWFNSQPVTRRDAPTAPRDAVSLVIGGHDPVRRHRRPARHARGDPRRLDRPAHPGHRRARVRGPELPGGAVPRRRLRDRRPDLRADRLTRTSRTTPWRGSPPSTLPILALSFGSIAGVSQQIRGSMLDALNRDYVRTLRSRGLSETRIVYKHVLRNAGGPALAVLALQFVGLFGGAVIIEQIFAIPGIGQISVSATSQGDVPIVMGLVLVTAIIVVVVNLVVDLLQGFPQPEGAPLMTSPMLETKHTRRRDDDRGVPARRCSAAC